MEATPVMEYKWDESMETGSSDVDQQHKELIRQLNMLLFALSQGQGDQQIEALMKFLSTYVVEHFRYEEQLMDVSRCPVAQANKAAHIEFIGKLGAFQIKLGENSANKTTVAIQMLRELSTWLVNHIRKIDVQLQGQLKTIA